MKDKWLLPRCLRPLARSDAGAAALELAVVLPVLILLAIGVADFGRAFFAGITVANAAHAGALYGSQSTGTAGDFAGINAAATADGTDAGVTASSSFFCRCPSSTSDVSCAITCTSGGYINPELFIRVTASRTVGFILRYPGLPSSVAVTRTAIMRVQ